MARKRKKLTMDAILSKEPNLATMLDANILEKIGYETCNNFTKDKDSRSEWEERSTDLMKLALQIREVKNYPWPNASNVKYPLLTIAAVQFASRIDMFPGRDIVRVETVGWDERGSKIDRAIRISKHMTYQLRRQLMNWEDDNDQLLHALPIIGSMFKKTHYCPIDKKNRSDLVYPEHLVFDYWARDVESATRKTHMVYLTNNEVIERVRGGLFLDVDLEETQPEPPTRPLDQEHEGMVPEFDEDSPRIVLEQHCWYDLDNDGYQEPYIFTVDYQTQKILRIVPRFDRDGLIRRNGEILKIEPDEYFTQFKFWPDPSGGNLGIGLGHLQGPINEASNSLINQLIDAGTLNNLGGGFIGSGIRMRGGEHEITPGEWQQVRSDGADLARNIVPYPFKEPSQVLFLLLQMLVGEAQKIGSITDAMVGEQPPANTPATTTLALIEQGMRPFKKIHSRLYRAYSKEFEKIYRLNAKYLPKKEYFSVLDLPIDQAEKLMRETLTLMTMQDQRGVAEGQMFVMPSDYKQDNDVFPTADPNVMTNVEKLKKIEVLFQTMQLGWNPEAVKRRFVESMEFTNPQELLAPPPPPPPDPRVQIEQAKMQMDQMKMQVEGQKNAGDLQIRQAELQIEAQKARAEIEQIQMETAKIEAEIRQILAEMEPGDGRDVELELRKLLADQESKREELELKRQELQLRNKEIDTDRQTKLDLDKNREYGENVPQLMERADALGQALQEVNRRFAEMMQPKEIQRGANGLLEQVGNMRIRRDEQGQAVAIEPVEG